jgi:valyl-tRNA synthetase
MSHELPKTYDPGAIELRWAEYWVKEKLFSVKTPQSGSPEASSPQPAQSPHGLGTPASRPIFTLLLPPPNVTGRLHMGHMLNQTEMDIIIRWRRMRGFLTLWLPGTDHAGIATQMMVERQLATEGKSRQQLGREAFVQRVWEWKKHYGGAIQAQMKRLGASVDWDREYFTMDENLSRAVIECFVRLHEEGLIYRGKYIVNWCPRCMTAISDLEVVHEDFAGKLYQIRYPLADDSKQFLTVATTRPETMLGDTAVAVNPKDERYKNLVDKKLRLPLMEREIPIVADDFADPQFGSGAVKVTPAHDPNDFQIGLRHNLPQINVMDEQARINQNGGPYAGLDRYEAREKILHDLEERGVLAGIKDHAHAIGKCDRCKTIVEPRLSTQWFIKIQPLADRAIAAVEKGEIKFTPENYAKTYFEWMRNIHDWCISRQLWWGHRIPAWHCSDCGEITVARSAPAQCKCGSGKITQDPDVLDTWFSSGLLPFTVFGWPEKTRDLDVFYPTTLLITGFDILFFWVARMIMLGCHFMDGHPQGSVPFTNVYIHALVRDADRQKMSKTKGNVIDPIEVTEKYGTDAVRFTLASMASPGTDIAFSESRTDGYRAFANKIWNAARFMFMNMDRLQAGYLRDSAAPGMMKQLEDRWIYSRFYRVAGEVNQALEGYRFDEAANAVYSFFWGEFCDWYLELIKPRLLSEDMLEAGTALALLCNLFDRALRLLSPFMPFITEEVWHAMYEGRPQGKSIALAPYPELDQRWLNDEAEEQMTVLQDLIEKIRNMRAEMKVPPREKTPVRVHASTEVEKLVQENRGMIDRLASVQGIEFVAGSLAQAPGARTTAKFEVALVYEQKIDVAAERERLNKELSKFENELANANRQLGNEQFLAKAPANVVEGIRRRAGELALLIEKGKTALAKLG